MSIPSPAGSAAERILHACLEHRPWDPADLRYLIQNQSPELFAIVAEGLSDRFEPRLTDVYGEIFAEAVYAWLPARRIAEIGEAAPESCGPDGRPLPLAIRPSAKLALLERYRRVRRPRAFTGNPSRVRAVYVLSRVTLGADIAITSVLLDAAKRRFPEAHIILVGGEKSYGLFSADPSVDHLPVSYARNGGFKDRLSVWPGTNDDDAIVIDPDSRITQLGLVPVCPEKNYYLFDSRSYGGDGCESLGALTRRWAREVFGVANAKAYLAQTEQAPVQGEIAVSLGVGGNAAKRLPQEFEAQLLAGLSARGPLVVDRGAGGDEAVRVQQAIARSGAQVETWNGSFAGFASIIRRARLYVGYDSAGQHAAAACGTPLISIFAGYPCERFWQRWRPVGPAPTEVVLAERRQPTDVLAEVLAAAHRLLGRSG